MTILLIDDDATGIKVRHHLLQVSGYSVISALTGGEGLAACTGSEIDLAVIDYQLPDISGESLITRLRELLPDAPVILLSGQMSVPDATLTSVDAAIVKGEGARKLLETIATFAPRTGK